MKKRLAISLSFLMLGAVAISGCQKKPDPVIDFGDEDEYCVKYDLPNDNDPTKHTGIENLGYMAKVLSETKNYKTDMTSEVVAQILIEYKQQVRTIKNFADNVMVVDDISTSAFVNTATQACFMGDTVAMRNAASSKAKDWDVDDMDWVTGEPTIYDAKDYIPLYGLLGTEFSVYVINEKTVTDASPVTKTSDGNYSQTFTFHPVDSSAYYRARMKQMGGLADYPEMHSIQATYVFNDHWQVLSTHYEENYGFKLNAFLSSDHAVAISDTVYTYGNAKVPDYYSYFYKYQNSDPNPGPVDKEPTATDYLLEAVSPIFAGGATYALDGTFRDASLKGSVSIALSPMEVVANINDLTIGYLNDKLYVGYYDFAGKTSLEKLLDALKKKGGEGGDGSGEAGENTDVGSLDELMQSFSDLDMVKEGDKVTLSTILKFGSQEIPLSFYFTDNKTISLDYIQAELNIDGETLYLKLNLGGLKPVIRTDEKDITACLDQLIDVIVSDNIGATLSYEKDDISIQAQVGLKQDISADFVIKVGETSLKGKALLAQGNIVYLELTEVNGEVCSLKIKCELDALQDVVPQQLGETEDASTIGEIVYTIFTVDYSTVLKSINEQDGVLYATINADPILSVLGITNVGDVSLELGDSFTNVNVYGLDLSLNNNGYEFIPEGNFANVTNTVANISDLLDFAARTNYYVEMNTNVTVEDMLFNVKGVAKLWENDGWNYKIDLFVNQYHISFVYDGFRYYFVLPQNNMRISVLPSEIEPLTTNYIARFGEVAIGIPSGETVASVVSIAQIINGLTILENADSIVDVRMNFDFLIDEGTFRAIADKDFLTITTNEAKMKDVTLSNFRFVISDGEGKDVNVYNVDYTLYTPVLYSFFDFAESQSHKFTATYGDIKLVSVIDNFDRLSGVITYGDVRVDFTYYWNTLFIKMGDVYVKTDLDHLDETIEALLPKDDADLTVNVLGALFAINPYDVRMTSFANNTITLNTKLGDLIRAFGMDYAVDEVDLNYDVDEKMFFVNFDGILLTLQPTHDRVDFTHAEYVSIEQFLANIDKAITVEYQSTLKVDRLDLIGSIDAREKVYKSKYTKYNAIVEVNYENDVYVQSLFSMEKDKLTKYAIVCYDGEMIEVTVGSFKTKMFRREYSTFVYDLVLVLDQVETALLDAPAEAMVAYEELADLVDMLQLIDAFNFDDLMDAVKTRREKTVADFINGVNNVIETSSIFVTEKGDGFGVHVEPIKITKHISIIDTEFTIRAVAGVVAEKSIFIRNQEALQDELDVILEQLATREDSMLKTGFELGTCYSDIQLVVEFHYGSDLNSVALHVGYSYVSKVGHPDRFVDFVVYDGDDNGTFDTYFRFAKI